MQRVPVWCSLLIAAAVLAAGTLAARDIVVTRSPHSPPEQLYWVVTEPTEMPMAAFRFAASGAPVEIRGIALTVRGTGDFSNDLMPGDGLQAWLDDGDGMWNPTKDTMVAIAAGAAPRVPMNFVPLVDVAAGSHVDIWIVAHFWGTRNEPLSYCVAISDAFDVDAPGASVILGSPEPKGSLIGTSPGLDFVNQPRDNTIPCQVATTSSYSALIWSLILMIATRIRRLLVRRQMHTPQR
jgi:hypothetical protein